MLEASIAEGKTSSFKLGLQAGSSIAIGYFPIALTFGLLSKTTGLSLLETLLMSLIVYAGASQYMGLSLIAAGTSPFVIILTTFVVNIRHFLMTAALSRKVEEQSKFKRGLFAFGITDETFSVLATRKGKFPLGYGFGVTSIAYASWVINSGIGYVIGANLPQFLQASMTVALYAMFIGLLVPSLKRNVKVLFLAAISAGFNSIFIGFHVMEEGWSIITSTLLSAVLIEITETYKRKKRVEER
ncbi:AzlC family ABC transporter permease [Weizmannia acidilactici]|uniref:AzlC family ABC transporter permease n=1 Tax=Weizmannia acidilactici TaxID=2607726 RepID=UPI00124E4B3C|nr:AzlC family ABC transporter permease [Weizmannia acidilactici]